MINQQTNKNKDCLVFLDIEATGQRNPEIIQLCGFKVDNYNFNAPIVFNQKYHSSQQIPLMLKNKINFKKNFVNFKHYPKMNAKRAAEIHAFLENTIIVTYGNFDETLLRRLFDKYELDSKKMSFLDITHIFENPLKINYSLNELAQILKIKCQKNNLHDAKYDAWLLMKITQALDIKKIQELKKVLIFYPKHKISFNKTTKNNLICRQKSSSSALIIKHFDSQQKVLDYEMYDYKTDSFRSYKISFNKSKEKTNQIVKILQEYPLYISFHNKSGLRSLCAWANNLNIDLKYINLSHLHRSILPTNKKIDRQKETAALIKYIGEYFYAKKTQGTKEYWIQC
ncbi:ribonuclease H-like domain-containing protein [Ureaplasma miroungigenitalium]|uniref:Ribonuclease H-like domain-containing protein n=1 Tax=Ureaplasma miroungigenitalium TaxID=1042321 RepID=A0ABT3BMP6_9BACT|nr:ribonuclease H-like domain-containing protein [Ureaplasma miroungigenitalium]MCV3728513.1 ribonuclease H-like domain-containing protein [Ureaplasma miroungigenitalium]MCV3734300.1 ribonuclease H-like domain-containing protein [Ureaplasma miroungigenitalium]